MASSPPTPPPEDRERDFPEITPPMVAVSVNGFTTGIYPSAYRAARNYLEDYKTKYAPEAIFDNTPAASTITNGLSRSSGGFFTTFITENRNGKNVLPCPVIFQIISNE